MIKYMRDPMNGFTHFVGFLLAITGLVFLLIKVVDPVSIPHVITFSVFGGGMILLFLASTLYHWLPLSEKGIQRLRRFDHCMIFVYIAATYTPICVVAMRGGWGWSLFGCVWGLALCGILLKFLWMNAPRWLSTSIYLGMGWLVVVGVWPLIQALQTGALFWLLAGGLTYSAGAVIYALKKPDPWPGILGFHEIFHLFVIGGSFCHFWVMYEYVSKLGWS